MVRLQYPIWYKDSFYGCVPSNEAQQLSACSIRSNTWRNPSIDGWALVTTNESICGHRIIRLIPASSLLRLPFRIATSNPKHLHQHSHAFSIILSWSIRITVLIHAWRSTIWIRSREFVDWHSTIHVLSSIWSRRIDSSPWARKIVSFKSKITLRKHFKTFLVTVIE